MSLNPEQNAAVKHLNGPLLILAGAGSGKTRVITQRVAHLISIGVPPENILAMSFTNKAAGEMRERVAQIIGKKTASCVHLSTFHALGAELLRTHIDRIGFRKPFTILDTGDQLKVLREVLEHEGFDRDEVPTKDVLAVISRAKNAFCQPKALKTMRFNPMVPYAQTAFKPYMEACRALNAVDFDDLQTLPIKLFKEHPDVLLACRQLYRFIMVDEYQDTNDTQLLVLRLLAAPDNNICVVGDDDQAIYAFRGAVTRNILNFEKHFPGARVIKLEQNYRSTSIILEAANAVVRNNPTRREKDLWSDLGRGEPLEYYALDDEAEEASFVVSSIDRSGRQGGLPWSEFAILMRTARLSQLFEEELQAAEIPYRLIGGTRFFDRREVKDLVSYLQVLLNPSNELALRRIINTPPRGVGHTSLAKLGDHAIAHKRSIFATLEHPEQVDGLNRHQQEALRELHALLTRYRRDFRKAQPPELGDLLERLMDDLKFKAFALSLDKSEKIGKIRLDNLAFLVNSLRRTAESGGDLEKFVARCTLAEGPSTDAAEEEEDTVTLMTLHGSKGLEFPHVFLVGFEEGLLPHARSLELGGDGDVEEERRLLYVGITRAQKKLILTSARTRGRGTARKQRTPSRYLQEIPPDCLRAHTEGAPVEEAQNTRKRRLAQLKAMLDS